MTNTKRLSRAAITITGAGIMRTSSPYQLAKGVDIRVVLIDQFPSFGAMPGQTSGRIHQQYSSHEPTRRQY